MTKFFEYICKNCILTAPKTNKYEGIVNIEVRPVYIKEEGVKIYIRHYCFNCNSEEIVLLDSNKELDQTPYTKEKLLKRAKARFEKKKSS